MKKIRHESAMLDCLLRARSAEALTSRRVRNKLLEVVFESIRESH